ncbi:MAG: hypothetical protein HC900_00525 [Methylacidiphilales bacterium]|nr:hypothetical protein [Candidatus Methylacidiphilales bacterium]
MRALFGTGTPKEMAALKTGTIFVVQTADAIAFVVVAVVNAEPALLVVAIVPETA